MQRIQVWFQKRKDVLFADSLREIIQRVIAVQKNHLSVNINNWHFGYIDKSSCNLKLTASHINDHQAMLAFYTANIFKLTEKYFLDLRNMFLNQENIRTFSQNKKIYLAQTNFPVPSIRKFILI